MIRRSPVQRPWAAVVLVAYFVIPAALLFGPLPRTAFLELVAALQQVAGVLDEDLVVDRDVVEVLANVAVFVPLGALLRLALSVPAWQVVAACCSLSVVAEAAQAVLRADRYPTGRDVVANTVGAVFGLLLARALVAANR